MSSILEKRQKSLQDKYFQDITAQFRHNANAVQMFAMEIGEYLQWSEEEIADYGHKVLDVFTTKGTTDAVIEYAEADLKERGAKVTRDQLDAWMKLDLEEAV